MSYTIKAGDENVGTATQARTAIEAIRKARAMGTQGLPNILIGNEGGQTWTLGEFEDLYEDEARNA